VSRIAAVRSLAEAPAANPALHSEAPTMSEQKNPADETSRIKDPSDWTTGDEPMTGAQDSYLHTLARRAGEEVDDDLTKAEASMKIEELREKTGVAEEPPKRKPARKRAH
jgi:hypothetical protein